MSLENSGKIIDEIPVTISYRILELFSAGLYSSPNKAFEELVSNSYDALASKVAVHIPTNLLEEGKVIWVCDNGESMGKKGLKDLWKIGVSPKIGKRKKGNRLMIGQFGIGKLATYILTNKITYICKTKDGYFAVTMDYQDINDDKKLILDERELDESEVKSLLNNYVSEKGENSLPFKLWGNDSENAWTFSILHNLKPKVGDISEGRLKWILSTALPLNPNFLMFYNGDELKSSKDKIEPWKTWIFGFEDNIVNKNDDYSSKEIEGEFYVDLPAIKNVSGKIELYRDSLLKNDKSQKWGRSHGIFVMIRGRLINLDDPLFGMGALTHGVFNRTRIIVNANELDSYITSTRESVKDVPAKKDLERYLQKKFLEVRDWYFNEVETEKEQNRASYKVSHSATSLSRRPLLSVTKKFFKGEISSLFLTDFPGNLTKEEIAEFIVQLENDLTSESGLIKDVEWVTLRPEDPIAKLDIYQGLAKINLMHPFFSNFIEEVSNTLPLQLIAITEILSEALMLEQGVDEYAVKNIMQDRDRLLRQLTFSDKQNAPAVASLLKATLSDPEGLEDSLTKALSALGFETTPLGGSGKPDGKAVAYLEHKDSLKNYSLVYDAKSTKKDRIMASTAHISGVQRHRDEGEYQSDYALVVAIDFQGALDENSAVNIEAKNANVTLLRASDLIRLLILAAPKQLNFTKLRELFENCHTVFETSQWIDELEGAEVERGPIREILEAIYLLVKSDTVKPNITAVRFTLKERKPELDLSPEKIRSIIESLRTIIPNYISINGEDIDLQVPPEIALKQINQTYSENDVPFEFRDLIMKSLLKDL